MAQDAIYLGIVLWALEKMYILLLFSGVFYKYSLYLFFFGGVEFFYIFIIFNLIFLNY